MAIGLETAVVTRSVTAKHIVKGFKRGATEVNAYNDPNGEALKDHLCDSFLTKRKDSSFRLFCTNVCASQWNLTSRAPRIWRAVAAEEILSRRTPNAKRCVANGRMTRQPSSPFSNNIDSTHSSCYLTHLFVLSNSLWLLQVALVSLTASQKPKGAYTKSNVDENGLIAIYTALRLAP